MKRFATLATALLLALAMALPATAHPRVPEQSTCVLPLAAADGIHNAYFKTKEMSVARHVLEVRSPHFCDD